MRREGAPHIEAELLTLGRPRDIDRLGEVRVAGP